MDTTSGVEMASDSPGLVLALDIGGTWTRVAIVRGTEFLLYRREPTPSTPEEFEKHLQRLISIAEGSGFWNRLEAISVATIGPLDARRGVIEGAPNLGGLYFDLASLLHSYGKEVYIVNDAVASVWAEKVFGSAREARNASYITISTGIGGGFIVDDTLLMGKKGNAHEIGHIVVDAERRMPCGCGGRGHWEAYGGGGRIPFFAKYLVERGIIEASDSPLLDEILRGELTAKRLYGFASRGDPLAMRIVEEINKYHVAGFETVINVYDPEVIIVGGAIALNNWDLLVLPVEKQITKGSGLVTEKPVFRKASFGENEALVGAAAIAYKPPETLLSLKSY